MQPSEEYVELAFTANNPINWLMSLVLQLPHDARSSLKIDPLSLVGFTDVRHGSYGNQDRIAVAYCAEQKPASSWLLAIVCDGVGGSLHGERAAALTISTMALEMAGLRRLNAVDALREALLRAHSRTTSAFQSKSSTTAAALLITDNGAAIGWIGDSRVYEVSQGKARLLTSDDTLAGALAKVDSKLASELNDEYAERLSQAIGGANMVTPNVLNWYPSNEDAFCILCTDGVWKTTEHVLGALTKTCRDAPELMRRLLVQSDWLGGIDNASAVYVPPINAVRSFLANPANRSTQDAIVVCLPGPLQTLIQIQPVNNSMLAERPDRQIEGAKRLTSAPKKSSTKVKVDRSKRTPKRNLALANQLVIEEEPLDDTPPQSPIKIQSDSSSN